MNLQEENRNAQDQLKWKKEQFKHLEEAHRKLQDQFKLNKEEWERGKSALLEEISLLQTSLDSKTRILEDVQKRLEMCNQALAHEETRRKFLEVEVSEFKSRYEHVFSQCQQERSKFESLTVQRDEEIAKLRNSLGTKHTSAKEMEIRIAHLEQENQELRESLK
jgi:predicted  nucleic acid-binding Zn-ribbon protein